MSKVLPANQLGMAILTALGVDTKRVTGIRLDLPAGGVASLKVTRDIEAEHECKLIAVIEKYRVELIESGHLSSEGLTATEAIRAFPFQKPPRVMGEEGPVAVLPVRRPKPFPAGEQVIWSRPEAADQGSDPRPDSEGQSQYPVVLFESGTRWRLLVWSLSEFPRLEAAALRLAGRLAGASWAAGVRRRDVRIRKGS